jgi:predicted DNA-binding transcriptional regulator AlpA
VQGRAKRNYSSRHHSTNREVHVFTTNKIVGDGGYLPARVVWERYGVTSMTLYRWIASDLDFPAPVYLGRFRYWKIADLLAWEASRPSSSPAGNARQRR